MNTWFSNIVGTTGLKYAIAMIASIIATKLGLAEGEVAAMLTQLVAVAAAAWGMWESRKAKVVMQGERVIMSDLPVKTQLDIHNAIEVVKDKKLKPLFSK